MNLTKRVLVTRAPHQSMGLVEALRALGLEPVAIPAIEIAPPADPSAMAEAVASWEAFDWILFTSANAVEAVRQWRSQHDRTGPAKIAAIGPATAQALAEIGLSADLVPPQAVAESLTESLLPYARRLDGSPSRFLLIRAEEGREHLPETLRRAGAEVRVIAAYRTVIPESSVQGLRELLASPGRSPGAVTFTSSSTARNLHALCAAAQVTLPAQARRVSIGPITSEAMRSLGWPPHAEAPQATVAAVAETVASVLLGT